MKKFLDTSNLVTYQTGKYQGKYDWSNNIGKELYFEYDDISGYIKINYRLCKRYSLWTNHFAIQRYNYYYSYASFIAFKSTKIIS